MANTFEEYNYFTMAKELGIVFSFEQVTLEQIRNWYTIKQTSHEIAARKREIMAKSSRMKR